MTTRVLHLTTHLNVGGITTYILKLVKPFRSLDVETFVLSSGGVCLPSLMESGAHCEVLPIRTKNELHQKLFVALRAVKKIIHDNHIDVLHAHTRVTQTMAFWLRKMLGIPVVTTCHGFYKRRLGRRIIPAWGDRVIAISAGVFDHLANDFKVQASKIQLVNNAVDVEEIDAGYVKHNSQESKRFYGFGENDPVVGVISRLVADKGHEYLIRAIHLLAKDFPSIRLLIVGAGNYFVHLKSLVAKLQMTNRVVFTGNVPDVTKPLSATDIFALPAVWREGFGLSIVEAMACRKPVIVSNIWALNSLIQNQVTGILIEPKQAEPLADAIAELLKDKTYQVTIGERGRKMVEDFFTIDKMASGIETIYREVLQKSLTPVL